MSHLTSYLSRDAVSCETGINSKKRALQRLSELLSQHQPDLQNAIYEGILKREKIGSTALGHGAALPHARIADIQAPMVAVINLQTPVEFDAPDQQPVSIVVGLLVPNSEEGNHTHLQLLQKIASMLHNKEQREKIRKAYKSEDLYQALLVGAATHEAA